MSELEVQNRLDICNNCENKVGVVTPTCKLCACPLDYITKKQEAECPIKKWVAIDGIGV